VAWLLVTEDFDLLMEAIMVAVYLRVPWSPHMQIALHYVMATWDRLGFLPGPSLNTDKLRELIDAGPREKVREYVFCNIYHTMYVAGLLCASLLAVETAGPTEWCPPVAKPRDFAASCHEAVAKAERFCGRSIDPSSSISVIDASLQAGSVSLLCCLLGDIAPRRTSWRTCLNDFALPAGRIAQVLADAVIIHAVRIYDIPRLLVGFDEALMLPFPLSPTVTEAVGFLLHQQLPDGAIGAHMLVMENRHSAAGMSVTLSIAERLAAYTARIGSAPT
jgi:hypothetical protein